MDEVVSTILAIIVILISGGLLFWFLRGIRAGEEIELRQIESYDALNHQTGLAVETGKVFHTSPGRAGLGGTNSTASVAALSVLDYLAAQGSENDVSPLVTVGDGTLMVASQDALQGAYKAADREADYNPDNVRFQAAESEPMTYAAGATIEIDGEELSGNIMVGRFGSEIAIAAEAADRASLQQIMGSDDPMALGAMAPITNKLIVGEELFAASAYLNRSPESLAGLKVQDALRIIACAAILLAALVFLVV